MIEVLNKADITREEVQGIWENRRSRMRIRRAQFEPLWRNGLRQFLEGIITVNTSANRPLYNQIYEQYDTTLYSKDGLRFNNLKYPLIHAITMRALSTELPNKPKINWVAVGSNDQTKPLAFRYLFDQVLYEMDSDQEDFEVFLDRRVFGSAIVMVMTETYDLTVEDPTFDKETNSYVYKKKTKKVKKCLYRKLDLRHVFLDEHCTKTSLEDCNYAQVDEYFSPDAAKKWLKSQGYNEELIDEACVGTERFDKEAYDNWYDVNDAEFVRITHSFDKLNDRYHVLVGSQGICVNDINSPIPRIAGKKGKKIPLALAVQYKLPGAPYGYGDSHITTSFNQIKNLIRMMILEITQKTAKPILAIDPFSNFDEEGFEWGQDFVRVSPKDLNPINVNANIDSLYKLDETTDNDVIRVTGINVNDTTNVDVSETARKTIIRRESQNALIELTLNYMTSSFFIRLYTLLKEDVKLHYGAMLKSGEKIKVRTKNVKLMRGKGGWDEEKVPGFRFFDLKEQDIDLDMECDLEMGNIASSRELSKAIMSESLQALGPFAQFFDAKGIAQYIQENQGMPESVLSSEDKVDNQTTEQLANSGLPPEMLPTSEQAKMNLNPSPEQLAQENQAAAQGVPAVQTAGQPM